MTLSWDYLANFWFKALGGVAEHLNLTTGEHEIEFFWWCPVCKVEITSDSKEGVIRKIKEHLIEDKEKGIIK